jgi:hypothetical protein
MIAWEKPHCEPFRDPARVKSYLSALLGSGYRISGPPRLIVMEKGCAGHYMHGGQVDRRFSSIPMRQNLVMRARRSSESG